MKTIALMPVKNEAWILRTTLPSLKRAANEIIALVADTEDDSKTLIESHGGIVIDQKKDNVHFASWRQILLDEGRKRGGTHFIWLDADEAFTAPFIAKLPAWIARLTPGQKLALDWITIWKNPRQMRNDETFGRIYKDFVFCDDKTSSFASIQFHEGRTPGANEPQHWLRVPRDEGAVMHFQAVSADRFQIKQAFVRCREYRFNTGPAWEINQKYALTKDGPAVECMPVPEAWLEGFPGLPELNSGDKGHFLAPLRDYFKRYGIEHFEPMDIWHIESLKKEFIQTTGREPHPSLWPSWPVRTISHYAYALRRRLPFFK